MSQSTIIRVLLMDYSSKMRESLCSLLESEPDIDVIAQTEFGPESLTLAAELKPDVVVMGLDTQQTTNVEAIGRILETSPNVRVLVLSLHSDSRFAVRALHAGALGYTLKDCAFRELAPAIRAVVSNQTYLGAGVAGITREY